MTKRTIAELKEMFKTGAIPTGQDYADFLDTTYPDPLTQYDMIDPIPPTEPWTEYPEGTSAFVTYFERATMPEWADIFDNEDIPDGDMMVVTHKNSETGFCIQEVDTMRDGEFVASFSRVVDESNDSWFPLKGSMHIKAVNGVLPNEDGNVIVPTSGLNQQQVQLMIDNDRTGITATEFELGHVRVDGTTITIDDSSYQISANVGDSLTEGDVEDIIHDAHAGVVATETQLGHVKVDGASITADANGVISAYDGSANVRIHTSRVDHNLDAMSAGYQVSSKYNYQATTLFVYIDGSLLAESQYETEYDDEFEVITVRPTVGNPFPTSGILTIITLNNTTNWA